MLAFLDTHAWIWWVTQDQRLSRRAMASIQSALAREGVWISAISVWEAAKKVERGQLILDRPLRKWLDVATAMEGLFVAELTTAILIESCELPPPALRDPADQMIVATVRHHGGRLVTKDAQLQEYPHVQCVW